MIKIDFFGENAEFDHVGLAVASITDVLGSGVETVRDELQKVEAAFLEIHGLSVEVLEPIAADSPVKASVLRGQPLVHLGFRVPDMDPAVEKAREHGFHRISKPVRARAYDGQKVVWIFSKTYGLIELIEQKPDSQ